MPTLLKLLTKDYMNYAEQKEIYTYRSHKKQYDFPVVCMMFIFWRHSIFLGFASRLQSTR